MSLLLRRRSRQELYLPYAQAVAAGSDPDENPAGTFAPMGLTRAGLNQAFWDTMIWRIVGLGYDFQIDIRDFLNVPHQSSLLDGFPADVIGTSGTPLVNGISVQLFSASAGAVDITDSYSGKFYWERFEIFATSTTGTPPSEVVTGCSTGVPTGDASQSGTVTMPGGSCKLRGDLSGNVALTQHELWP